MSQVENTPILPSSTTANPLGAVPQQLTDLQVEVPVIPTILDNKTIVYKSDVMRQLMKMIDRVAPSHATVLVLGESGTGKELIARSIHERSGRRNKPFVAINCGALRETLLESELFGHEKGAFTGAVSTRAGKFEEANNGTIFLDEIGDMDLSLQVKLLRVLQEKSITRVGGTGLVKVNNRVIVATHKDLRAEVQKGNFREDLFYRIFGLTIHLPPLRERGKDVLLLAVHFINRFCKENQIPVKSLSDDAQTKLMSYSFPGNVRELKSLIELSCVLSSGNEIQSNDLHLHAESIDTGFFNDHFTLDDYIRKIMKHYLDKNDQNVVAAAQKLGIGKSTIYRMMKDEKGIG